jgi:hypothetical protein
MLVENASRAWAELHNLCHAGIGRNLTHDAIPFSPSHHHKTRATSQP